MNKIALTILTALACVAAQGQTATKLVAAKANEYGLVYYLPNTVLDITIETEFTEKTPGEFFNYAKRNLNINDAITKPSVKAAVKSVTIVPRGEANTENDWLLQLKPGQNAFIMVDPNGIPLSINTDPAPAAATPKLPEPQKAAPTPLETPQAKQAITQEMAMSTSLAKRAQLATERIFELRQNRNDLISGQADNTPPDGQSLQLALDNLSGQEAALAAMFAGTTRQWTEVATITYTPGTSDVGSEIIARLSPTEGVIDASDLSGEPIYLAMSIVTKGEIPLDEKDQPKPFPKNGVAYNIPGSAIFTVSFNGQEVASQQANIAQLGITYGLDPKIFTDKKAPAFVIFDPATGGIATLGIKE